MSGRSRCALQFIWLVAATFLITEAAEEQCKTHLAVGSSVPKRALLQQMFSSQQQSQANYLKQPFEEHAVQTIPTATEVKTAALSNTVTVNNQADVDVYQPEPRSSRVSQQASQLGLSFETRVEPQFTMPHWQPTLPAGENFPSPGPHLSVLPVPRGETVHEMSPQNPFLLHLSARSEVDVVGTRPNEGGKADVIKFGLFAKAFYGMNLLEHSFSIDSVVTLQWTDPRVADLLLEGQQSLTLSDKDSQKKLWLPDVEITNRDIRKIEYISTSVQISPGGLVTKLERSLAVIKNKFDLTAFPFDSQNLTINVASSKLGLDDVQLVPMNEPRASGVTDDLFEGEGFEFLSFKTQAFEDVTGMLRKSRGQMIIAVARKIDKYMQSHLIPSVIHLIISWGVFWFPFVMQFITPRLALSILALLSFTNLSLNIDKQLPPGAPFTWNDLYNQSCQLVLATTVLLNIFTEIVAHQLKLPDLAQRLNHECKIVWPIVAGVALTPICRVDDPEELLATHALSHKLLLFVLATYLATCVLRISKAELREFATGQKPSPKR